MQGVYTESRVYDNGEYMQCPYGVNMGLANDDIRPGVGVG